MFDFKACSVYVWPNYSGGETVNTSAALRGATARTTALLLAALIALATLALMAGSGRAYAVDPSAYPPKPVCSTSAPTSSTQPANCQTVHTAPVVAVHVATPVTPQATSSGLAMTGAPAVATGVAGLLFLTVGLVMMLVSRRGRTNHS